MWTIAIQRLGLFSYRELAQIRGRGQRNEESHLRRRSILRGLRSVQEQELSNRLKFSSSPETTNTLLALE